MAKLTFSRPSHGFSLVEIMVGVVIGLITVLVATNVLINAGERKRASMAGADSTVNATLALYTLERDIKNAGFGIASTRSAIGCSVNASFNGINANFRLAPITITDGANGAPDQIRVMASTVNNFPLPIRILSQDPITRSFIEVESILGVQAGDFMIAAPQVADARDCSLFQATGVQAGGASARRIQYVHGQGQAQGDSRWNLAAGGNFTAAGPYPEGDMILNLGNFLNHRYHINAGELWLDRLQMQTNDPGSERFYSNIVQMQAVYGLDTDNDGDVNVWNADVPTNSAEWQSVIAVRVALVARSAVAENQDVTPDAAACNVAAPPLAAVCWRPDPAMNAVAINVNWDNATPNWRRFRYHVLETTVPLRNVIWF